MQIGNTIATRRTSVGAILSQTFSVFSAGFVKFSALGFILLSPILIYSLFFAPPAAQLAAKPGVASEVIGRTAIAFAVQMLLYLVIQAAVLYGAVQQLRGRSFAIGESLAIGLKRAIPVLAVSIAYGIATAVGMVLLFVPGMIVLCMCYLAVPVCVIEKPGIFASLGRSAELTKGFRWQIFGIVLLVSIVSSLVSGVLTVVISRIAGPTILALISFVWQGIYVAFAAVLAAVLYHDLRAEKDGVDVEEIAAVFE